MWRLITKDRVLLQTRAACAEGSFDTFDCGAGSVTLQLTRNPDDFFHCKDHILNFEAGLGECLPKARSKR